MLRRARVNFYGNVIDMCVNVVGASVAVGHEVAGDGPAEGVVAGLEADDVGVDGVGVVVDVFYFDAPAGGVGEVVGLLKELCKDVSVVEDAAVGAVEEVVGVHNVVGVVVGVCVLVGADQEPLSDVWRFGIADDVRLVYLVGAYRGVCDGLGARAVDALEGEVACKLLELLHHVGVRDDVGVGGCSSFIIFELVCLVVAAVTLVDVGVGEVGLVVVGDLLLIDGVRGVHSLGEVAVPALQCPLALAVGGLVGAKGGVVVAHVDVVAGVGGVNAGVINCDVREVGALVAGVDR